MDITSLIGKHEVVSSSQLLARLVRKGASATQSRQQMLREAAKGNSLWRSRHLALERNERLFARSSSVGSKQFFDAVARHLRTARPGLARCLAAAARRPLLLEYEVARLSASRLNGSASTRIPSVQEEMAALTEVGFRHEAQGTSLSHLVRMSAREEPKHSARFQASAKRAAETQLARIVGDHYRRLNLISWTSLNVADSHAGALAFNRMAFSGFAHSWAKPLVSFRKGLPARPTPVLFDVYARQCFDEDVAGFQSRLDRARHASKLDFALLGVIAAHDFTPAAFDAARREGLLVVNLRDLFGDAALDAMASVEALLADVQAAVPGNVASGLESLAERLAELRNNPIVVDIKSIALEILSGFVMRADGWEDVRLGVDVPIGGFGKGGTRDVDVLGMKDGGHKLRAIECKAHRRSIEASGADVKKFFSETIPALLRDRSRSGFRPKIYAEFWTTGIIGADAQRALAENMPGKNVEPRLIGLQELLKEVPMTLNRGKELLLSIAEV